MENVSPELVLLQQRGEEPLIQVAQGRTDLWRLTSVPTGVSRGRCFLASTQKGLSNPVQARAEVLALQRRELLPMSQVFEPKTPGVSGKGE